MPSAPLLPCLLLAALAPRLGAAELTLGDRHFSFPDDYTLEIAAAPPLLERPIEASFDESGRLYITESSGSNDPVATQLKNPPHRVLQLRDADGDGVFDQRRIFADHLMFPSGCLWHQGSLYVAAPPQILQLTDADGDGSAEQRLVWFDGKTLTGCANDLHGPYLGPDQLFYWCKGAFAEQSYPLPGQPLWKSSAAHVFRAKPSPSGPQNIEPVFTAGMDNPVGLAWTPEADLIVSGTFFQHPDGGQRDGLIHAVRGGVWGKDHAVLNGHPRTGPLMPPMTHLGPAAPCGMIRYGRDLLVCQFNLRKVSRHSLIPQGASYRTQESDFLLCDHPDFHPTDVLQAPDGSVLIVDTGGWYKLCCPTSQLAKPAVLGAIYRLRQKGTPIPLLPPPSPHPPLVNPSLADLLRNLTSPDPHRRREAAAALGPSRAPEAVPPLLEALAHTSGDRFLSHAYTFALLEIAAPAPTRLGLSHPNPSVQAGALYALEQMPSGALTPSDLLPLLHSPDPPLAAATLFVLERHRDWALSFIPWLDQQWNLPLSQASPQLLPILSLLSAQPPVAAFIGKELSAPSPPDKTQRLLETLAHLPPAALPAPWKAPLAHLLAQANLPSLPLLLTLLKTLPLPDRTPFFPALTLLANASQTDPPVRLQALALLPPSETDDATFAFLLAALSPPATRAPAAARLAAASLSPDQLRRLSPCFAAIGVLERPLLLQAFKGQSDETAGLALVQALEISGALPSTPPDTLRDTFAKFPPPVQQALAAARARHTPPDQAAHLDALEKNLPPGDIARGLIAFQSPQASCASCHPIGYKGGRVGPDLSKVGAIRTPRDLLEAIVYPHASFVRSYEPILVTRRDGSTLYGIARNRSPQSLTLVIGPTTPDVLIPQDDIQSIAPGQFSLMPQGLDQALRPQELADIIAFLHSRR